MKKIKMILGRFTAAALAFALAAFLFSTPAAAEEGDITVYVRVECAIPGAEETLLPKTSVTLADVHETTALAALMLAADGEVEADFSEYGAWIHSVLGVGETPSCSWMYSVNDEIPAFASDQCELNDGDEVVFYCLDWQVGAYSYFKPSSLTVGSGENFKLSLYSADWEGESPVAGANIAIKSDNPAAIMQLALYFTDENGETELFLVTPGIYEISASKYDDEGVPVISRPLAFVTVVAAPEEAPEDANSLVYDIVNETVSLYGITLQLDEGSMPSTGEDGALYFPVRAVAEKLGADVYWDAATFTATISYGGISFSFVTIEPIDGYPVMIIDGHAYIPTTYFAKQLGLDSVTVLYE